MLIPNIYPKNINQYTVKSLFVAAATIGFDLIFRQNLLSKNCFLLRPLFKGGYYLRAATNKDFTVNENGGTVHGEYKSFSIIAYKPRHNILHIYFTSWDPIFWGKESFDGLPVSWECTKK